MDVGSEEWASDATEGLRDEDGELKVAQEELELWTAKVEKADDAKARLTLEKLDKEETKRQVKQEMKAFVKKQEDQQKEFDQALSKVQEEIQSLDERKQDLLAKLKACRAALQAKSKESIKLRQKFKICAHIPDSEVNFTAEHKEAAESSHPEVEGVFTIRQRVTVPLKGGQALITFEEEKVASKVLKLPKCSVSLENNTVDVTPRRITLDPAVKFEIHLNVSRTALKVSNVPPALPEERVKDRLEMSFSKPSRGGGEVDGVEYDHNTGTGRITFLHPGVADSLAMRGKFQVDLNPEVTVQVAHVYQYQLRKFQTFCGLAKKTVLLDGIEDLEDLDDDEEVQDLLEIHFQKPSNGGEIESIKYTSSGKDLQAFFRDDAAANAGH